MTDRAQLDLLDMPRTAPYQRTSPTSREAARKVRPKAGSQRARVYAFLQARPSTMHEIAEALRIPLSGVCARCSELRDAGLAHDTKETRPTQFHGRAAVWKAT